MFDKGIHKENIGEYNKALNALFYALSLCPNSADVYVAIARVYRKIKLYYNSLEYYTKVYF